MKDIKILTILAFLIGMGSPCLADDSSQISLVQAGTTSLVPGQYMITNINTGQALYAVVDSGGKLQVQDPRALQFSASQAHAQPLQSLLQQPQAQQTSTSTQAAPGTQPAGGATSAVGGLGGLLKKEMGGVIEKELPSALKLLK